ncbi:MAG: TonB-dependent receptor [Steroidobacteraceae bacterium]
MNRGVSRFGGVAHSARLGLAAAIAAVLAAPAIAQDSGSKREAGARVELEEVIVTGTKRAESVQEVPIAITAISGEMMAGTFRNDILSVANLAPGVTLGQMAGFRAISGGIRGTGQNSILVTQDASVAVLVDEFGLNNVQAQFVENFDVERIEIYRGPQGTLFGKNSTGGAISIVTKRPVMNEFEGDAELQYGKFKSNGGAIMKGKLALNIPLIQDKLAMRITGIYDYDDGPSRNDKVSSHFPTCVPLFDPTCSNGPLAPPPGLTYAARGDGQRVGGTDVFATKVKFLFTPTDNYEAYFFTEFLRDRSDSVPAVNESPAVGEIEKTAVTVPGIIGGPQFYLMPLMGWDGINTTKTSPFHTGISSTCFNIKSYCIPSGHKVSVDGYHLHQKLELDQVTLQLLAGLRKQKEILPSSYAGEAFSQIFDASRNLKRKQTQFELRASTKLDGPLNFVTGATYQTDDVDFIAYTNVGFLGVLNADPRWITDPDMQRTKQDRSTIAAYLDGTWKFTDQFSFTAGARFTRDKKKFHRWGEPGGPCTALTDPSDQVVVNGQCLDSRSNFVSRTGISMAELPTYTLPIGESAFGVNVADSKSWKKVTWRAVANYQVNEDALAYLSYSTGFISGGYTEQCKSIATCQPFSPETNWTLETGLKSRWMDGRVQANLAAYLTRYKDLVRSQVVPFTNAFGVTTQETVNVNAGTSEAYGLEAEISFLATDSLRFDVNGSYLHHKYKTFVLGLDTDANPLTPTVATDLSDLTVPFSPKWKLGASGTYRWNLGASGTMGLNASVNYQSKGQISVFNSIYSQMNAHALVDASLNWTEEEGRYSVTLWGKNLTNKKYRIGSNPVAGLWNMTNWGNPMTYGVEVGVHF